VQIDPSESPSESAWFQRLNLTYHESLTYFAFNFYLRLYTEEGGAYAQECIDDYVKQLSRVDAAAGRSKESHLVRRRRFTQVDSGLT
jgi:hypothetical protein